MLAFASIALAIAVASAVRSGSAATSSPSRVHVSPVFAAPVSVIARVVGVVTTPPMTTVIDADRLGLLPGPVAVIVSVSPEIVTVWLPSPSCDLSEFSTVLVFAPLAVALALVEPL